MKNSIRTWIYVVAFLCIPGCSKPYIQSDAEGDTVQSEILGDIQTDSVDGEGTDVFRDTPNLADTMDATGSGDNADDVVGHEYLAEMPTDSHVPPDDDSTTDAPTDSAPQDSLIPEAPADSASDDNTITDVLADSVPDDNTVPDVTCTPDCTGKECGDNGCGGSCGFCADSSCNGPLWIPAEKCEEGRCQEPGFSLDCDDDIKCTWDECNAKTGCSNSLLPDQCYIYFPEYEASACVNKGQISLGYCAECDPSKDPNHISVMADGAICLPSRCRYSDSIWFGGWYWQAEKQCHNSVCQGPSETLCSFEETCKQPECDEMIGCTYTIEEGYCLIQDTCYGTERTNPSNVCQVCRPSNSQTTWSPKCREPNPDCQSDGTCACWTGSSNVTCDSQRSNHCLSKLGGCRCGESAQCDAHLVCRLINRTWSCVRP